MILAVLLIASAVLVVTGPDSALIAVLCTLVAHVMWRAILAAHPECDHVYAPAGYGGCGWTLNECRHCHHQEIDA